MEMNQTKINNGGKRDLFRYMLGAECREPGKLRMWG